MTVTLADIVALALRAASFAAVLQAAGIPLFVALSSGDLRRSLRPMNVVGARMAFAAVLLVVAQQVVEPARLAGSLGGVLDASLQAMMLQSGAGAAAATRLIGLVLLLVRLRATGRVAAILGVLGISAIVASFALMGHTTSHEPRSALAALLLVHIAVIAFWFGALVPLRIAVATEDPDVAARIVTRFSHWAAWLVPAIGVAGVLLAALLLPWIRTLGTPFGLALVAKLGGFTVLLSFGAANKWLLGPRLATGDQAAARALQRSLACEWVIIVVILMVTAVLTGLFAPED